MILSLIAVLVFGRQQQPAGVNVAPSQAAFYSAAGGTAVVEVRNYLGQLVPLVDTAGISWPNATVTLPAATAVGLGWELTQTSPDTVHKLVALPPAQYTAVIKMVGSTTATESPVGTYDCSAGTGNGIASGFPAPTSSTPTVFAAGGTYTIAQGSIITAGATAVTNTTLASILTAVTGVATLANQPIAPDPMTLAFFDVGGAGDTINLDCQDALGHPLAFIDSNSVSWYSIRVTLGAGAAASSMYLALQTAPDGTHLITTLPTGCARTNWYIVTGGAPSSPSVAMNYGGLASGAAGTGGTGYNTGLAPTANSGSLAFVNDSGFGGH